jgi:ABC-type polysaccharide/polyol phosphate export permease
MKNKNFFTKYTDYLKDNPKNYWFKQKLFGYGWTPAKWQGWVVILLFLAYIVFLSTNLSGQEPTTLEIKNFIFKLVISIIILLIICILTGEKPHWQWGLKKIKK